MMLELNGTIIAVIANFLILAWILSRFFYKPIEDIIESRKKSAAAVMDEAEKKLSEAEALKHDYEEKMKEAEDRSGEIIKSAAAAAKDMQKDIIDEARKEAGNIIASASRDAERLKQEVYSSVRSSVASLVCAAAGKLLRGKIDREADNVLIEDMISDLERTGLN